MVLKNSFVMIREERPPFITPLVHWKKLGRMNGGEVSHKTHLSVGFQGSEIRQEKEETKSEKRP